MLALHRRMADRDVKVVSPVQPDGHEPLDVTACLQIWLPAAFFFARPPLPVAGRSHNPDAWKNRT